MPDVPTQAGRRSDLMVSVLDSEASGLGSSPGWEHCVLFLGETLYSRSVTAPLSTQVYKWIPAKFYYGGNPAMD